MEITIRKAIARDYGALCGIIDQGDALHRERLPHIFRKPQGPPREREHILQLLADEHTGFFVAEVEGRAAGFVHVAVHDTLPMPVLVPRRSAVVHNLVVKEEFRRAGIGRVLMYQAQRWALDNGATEVELNVFEFNEPAVAFYLSLGYETVSRRMSKPLVPPGKQGGVASE